MNVPPRDAAGRKDRAGAPTDPPPIDRKVVDRKVLDDIFGDVLPETTGDERGSGWSDGGYSEEWYRENRPPHHGG